MFCSVLLLRHPDRLQRPIMPSATSVRSRPWKPRRRKVLVEIESAAAVPNPDGDGASAHSSACTHDSIPIEMIESSMPITMVEYGLAPGTGGDGRHRGGLGLPSLAHRQPGGDLHGTDGSLPLRPFGLDGGEPGAVGRLELVRDGKAQALHSKMSNMSLRNGDVIGL